MVMKFYPDEIKSIKDNFITKVTYSYLEIKAPEKCSLNEKVKVELDIKELTKVTEYSWIGLYEIGKGNNEYISYLPTPLGDVIGQPKSTIDYLMPSVSGEFEFRFFTSEYKRSHSSKVSKNKITVGYHTTTSKLLEGWQKGNLDEIKPKKLRFSWVISGFEKKDEKVEDKKVDKKKDEKIEEKKPEESFQKCSAQLISEKESKYSKKLYSISIFRIH